MEAIRRRSQSPFPRSKNKSHAIDFAENGNSVIEQVKRKKKYVRNKTKLQSNGKDGDDMSNSGRDYFEEETVTTNDTDSNTDSNSVDNENSINNGEGSAINNGNTQEEVDVVNENKENDAVVGASDDLKENVESNGKPTEIIVEECKSTESRDVEDESTEQCTNFETENGAEKDSFVACESVSESEVVCERSEETSYEAGGEITNRETNLIQEDSIAECSEVKETSKVSVNGSDGSSHYEEAELAEEHIQASPDTATKDDTSISHKITNLLGKWNYSLQKNPEGIYEHKQDSEVSSSKKIEESELGHPYLSKVSGRRGIRDRLNSSATVFSSNEMEAKTPENFGKISLDDSFRVRTNPPRLNSLDLTENPTLRKFKGKRCLNAGDEPEEEDDDEYLNTVKRRKLDEKTQESGLLGSILWSPFRKKPLDNEDHTKLETAESKLSKLLSPFWFWKKTATNQKAK